MTGQLKLKPKRTGIIEAINQNNSLIFIVFVLILGVLVGVLTFKTKNSEKNFYKEEFYLFYNKINSGFFKTLSHSLLENLPYAMFVFLSGTCMVGGILVPSVIVIRGINFGLIMSYTYSSLGLTGIIFNLLIIVPSAIVSSLALILSGREAFGFSLSLARIVFPKAKKPAIEQDFKIYCLRQLFVLLFFASAAFIQALMSASFISFFKF